MLSEWRPLVSHQRHRVDMAAMWLTAYYSDTNRDIDKDKVHQLCGWCGIFQCSDTSIILCGVSHAVLGDALPADLSADKPMRATWHHPVSWPLTSPNRLCSLFVYELAWPFLKLTTKLKAWKTRRSNTADHRQPADSLRQLQPRSVTLATPPTAQSGRQGD